MSASKNLQPRQRFRISPNWTITKRPDGIHMSAGDDMIYEVTCDMNTATFFSDTPSGFTRANLSADSLIVFEQLLSAEIIIPTVQNNKTTSSRVWITSNSVTTTKWASNYFSEKGCKITSSQPDIVIVIRTAGSLSNFLQTIHYKDVNTVHLFVDLAYHHTVSVGPLVFPRETPCIACLEGRLLARWGSLRPPTRPKAEQDLLQYALEIAYLEVARYNRGDTSLAFKTVAHNTDQRSIETYKLLTVPQCPYCMNENAYANGSLVI